MESAHRVATASLIASSRDVAANLTGIVRRNGSSELKDAVAKISSYRIEVMLPKNTESNLRIGQSVPVSLPIIRHNQVQAEVARIAPGKIELLLHGQVQELAGQQVHVKIPLNAKGIYQIPFWAVYSPRGLSKELFLFEGETVRTVPVEIVTAADNEGEIWITGSGLQPGNRFVVQGLDNLISGDRI